MKIRIATIAACTITLFFTATLAHAEQIRAPGVPDLDANANTRMNNTETNTPPVLSKDQAKSSYADQAVTESAGGSKNGEKHRDDLRRNKK
jgi:hypothetical protein